MTRLSFNGNCGRESVRIRATRTGVSSSGSRTVIAPTFLVVVVVEVLLVVVVVFEAGINPLNRAVMELSL